MGSLAQDEIGLIRCGRLDTVSGTAATRDVPLKAPPHALGGTILPSMSCPRVSKLGLPFRDGHYTVTLHVRRLDTLTSLRLSPLTPQCYN